MGKFHAIQNNATAGELSESLRRTDVSKYNNGWALMRNVYSRPQGSITRFPGTKYIKTALSTTSLTTGTGGKLLNFTSSVRSRYIIELGANKMRVLKGDGTDIVTTDLFKDAATATTYNAWNKNNSGTGSASGTVIAAGGSGITLNGGAGGIGEVYQYWQGVSAGNYQLSFTVTTNPCTLVLATNLGGTAFLTTILSVGTTVISFSATSGGAQSNAFYISLQNAANNNSIVTATTMVAGPSTYEIYSPYALADLVALSKHQSADVLYLACANNLTSYAPRSLAHYGPSKWVFNILDFVDGPYKSTNTNTALTITPSAVSGAGITLTATSYLFTSQFIQKYIRLQHSPSPPAVVWGWAKITAVAADGLTATATVVQNFGATTATSIWRRHAWDNTEGWPAIVVTHETRLGFLSNLAQPNTGWLTQTDSFSATTVLMGPTKSDGTVTDDYAITFTLAGKNVNKILWAESGSVLALGTTDVEGIVSSSSQQEALSPTNARAVQQTTRGSIPNCPPVRVDNSIVYVKAPGKQLCSFSYSFDANGYQSSDLNLLSTDILNDVDPDSTLNSLQGVQEIVFVQNPDSYIVARLGTGELRVLTYIVGQDVGGWARMTLGGTGWNGGANFSLTEQKVRILSMCVLPDDTYGYDALWLLVERVVNGTLVVYLEKMMPPLHIFKNKTVANSWYLDSAVKQTSGAPFTTVTGLSHLEGQTVGVIVDGGTHPDVVVSGGSVTLTTPALSALVGLPKDWRLESLPQDWTDKAPRATALGTSRGQKQQVNTVLCNFYKTGACYGGAIETESDTNQNNFPAVYRHLRETLGTATVYSGWDQISTGDRSSNESTIYLKSDPGPHRALPFTLLEMVYDGEVSESV